MAAVELEKTGLDHVLGHILTVDSDCRAGGTYSIQHYLNDFIYAGYIKAMVLSEVVYFKILPD